MLPVKENISSIFYRKFWNVFLALLAYLSTFELTFLIICIIIGMSLKCLFTATRINLFKRFLRIYMQTIKKHCILEQKLLKIQRVRRLWFNCCDILFQVLRFWIPAYESLSTISQSSPQNYQNHLALDSGLLGYKYSDFKQLNSFI